MWKEILSSDGRRGRYQVRDGTVTVECNGRSKSTQIGNSTETPEALARVLLAEPDFAIAGQ